MSHIASPCIRVCVIDEEHRLCVGCGRTLDEIGAWLTMPDAERRRIMTLLDERLRKVSGSTQREG